MGAPILTFAGPWEVPWLVQVHGLEPAQAGGVVSLLLVTGLPLPAVITCLVVAGLASGVMPVAFAVARDAFGSARAGRAAGVVNSSVLLAGATVQVVVGGLLDLNWSGPGVDGVQLYASGEWRLAMAILPVSALVATIAAPSLRQVRPRGSATYPMNREE